MPKRYEPWRALAFNNANPSLSIDPAGALDVLDVAHMGDRHSLAATAA